MDVDGKYWRRAAWKVLKEYLYFFFAIAAVAFVIIGAWIWNPIVVLIVTLVGFAVTCLFLIWCIVDDVKYEVRKTAYEMQKEEENVAED